MYAVHESAFAEGIVRFMLVIRGDLVPYQNRIVVFEILGIVGDRSE